MINLRSNKIKYLAAFGGIFLMAAGTRRALADPLAVTILAPGVQAPTGITSYYETFDHVTPSGGMLTTNFNGSPVTGTYTGDFTILSADAFGGAGGSSFISTTGKRGAYTLTLNKPVNYFGLWFSALDAGNHITFFNGKSLVDTFTPGEFIALAGTCASKANPYCGNPNNHLDAAEQFAFLNFYDATGAFDKIVFDQDSNGGEFESDNQAVASLDAPPGSGTSGVVPEPASLVLWGTGLVGFAGIFRRQFLL